MTLFEFNTEQNIQQWHTENDVVMGGVSKGRLTYLPEGAEGKGAGRFNGEISLENGGGFAQILFDEQGFDLTRFQGVELHVRGDDQTYQVRLETDAERVAYAQSFLAKDEWQRVRLAFADFESTFHGEVVPDAPDLNLAAVRTVGF